MLYVGERLSYSARVWEGKLPAGDFLINLYQIALWGFYQGKVLDKLLLRACIRKSLPL